MAQLDEGIGNLQRFISLLSDCDEKLEDGLDALEQVAGDFDRLEGEADDALGGLDSALADIADEVREAAEDTTAGVDALEQAAREIAEERCYDLGAQSDDAAQAFADTVDGRRDELQSETASVVSHGFQQLSRTLDTVTGEVKTAGESAGEAVHDVTAQARASQTDAETRFETAGAAMEAASAAMDALESALAEGASRGLDVVGEASQELEGECASMPREIDGTYAEIVERIQEAADGLAGDAKAALDAARESVATEASDPIADATALAADQAGNGYDGALDEVQALMEEALAAAEDLEPLVPELDTSQSVVGTIDRMLQAME